MPDCCGGLQLNPQQDWLYVAGIIGGTVVLLLLAIALVLWIVVKLWASIAQ
jgi:hypothetical protein